MQEIVTKFWQYIDKAEFDMLKNVMSENATVTLPNTKEIFINRSKFIEFNKEYPGRWYAKVVDIKTIENTVISVAHVSSKDVSFYVNSYFNIQHNKIVAITEYWGENGEAPTWRQNKGFSVVYK